VANVNIVFPKTNKASSAYTYADIHLDLELQQLVTNEAAKNTQQQDIAADYDLGAIRNSIVNLFLTSPGDKILNPEFGMDLRDYLFMPTSDSVAGLIRDVISRNITTFEPRIAMQQLEVIPDYDNQQYTINMTVQVPFLQNSTLNLSGSINSQGYATFI
jgi:phage baseplate assembly protein W